MKPFQHFFLLFFSFLLLPGCKDDSSDPEPAKELLQLVSVKVGNSSLQTGSVSTGIPTDRPLVLRFSEEVNRQGIEDKITLEDADGQPVALTLSFLDQGQTVSAQPAQPLRSNHTYTLTIDELTNSANTSQFPGAAYTFTTLQTQLRLQSLTVDGQPLSPGGRVHGLDPDFTIRAVFSEALEAGAIAASGIRLSGPGGQQIAVRASLEDPTTLLIKPEQPLNYLSRYELDITSQFYTSSELSFSGFRGSLYIQPDPEPKFPLISDEALLTLVQQQTFKYFWDFAHPSSGLARERNSSGNLVTIGGSGFGVMTIPVGIERGFITRQQGVDRLEKIVNFLATADRFHGVWPHWMDGTTGRVIAFSQYDNGGDLIETAFMIQGLLTVRQYLNRANAQEAAIIATITRLWEEVEWDWYTRGENVLYWHWSPQYEWQMNMQIRGYNEGLIAYVLAASSPTHPISPEVYHQGWARGGAQQNGNTFYDITLPLGENLGGPLFFAHYSYLGLDPRRLEDRYANYWEQNVAHTRINQAYVADNPRNWVGYSAESWGLTASDNQSGYSAHSPTNDLGVITPTAALSSFPYTPEASMAALRYFYYTLGDRLWGPYGFYDAYNLTVPWFASSYLAIDQGPIIIMIENYRTQLLWNLFMSNPEIAAGLDRLDFSAY
ncbi:glucoamylase family protein [Cesiribacter andamanensis]|uniref:Glycoamylase-like domain-containing protein n=1 Tax=Cesiribacter andamanensis AMV16 TaxID=1279009 RepID=M7N703_9BACT|nr:glucoamylase family protein [Cesiribacter andamanensis]EMR03016.1 hypothetical protein ADICEAN_01865 [Cesiribacter andamanensis AMV16]